MGNAHVRGHGVLLQIDKPLIPDLDPEEDVVVELIIHGQPITIDSWPAQAIVIPPPVDGVLRLSVFAVNQEDDKEARDCGQVLIPHEACEMFNEPAFVIHLGLMHNDLLPFGEVSGPAARDSFEKAMDAAKDPRRGKVGLLFAACERGLESWQPEEMWKFVNEIQDRPMMRLLNHHADIIREQHLSEAHAMQEVTCSLRDFASKERVYQGFVNTARVDKLEMEQSTMSMRSRMAEMFFSDMKGFVLNHAWRMWKHWFHEFLMEKNHRMCKLAGERTARIMNRLIEPHLGAILEASFYGWRIAAAKPTGLSKVVATMVVSGVDMHKLQDDYSVLGDFETVIKDALADASGHRFEPDNVRITLSKGSAHHHHHNPKTHHHNPHKFDGEIVIGSGRRGSQVGAQYSVDNSADKILVRASIQPHKQSSGSKVCGQIAHALGYATSLSNDLSLRLVSVPGIFSSCSGPIKIDGLSVSYMRGLTDQGIRNHNNRVLGHMVDIIQSREHEHLMHQVTAAWHKEAIHAKAQRKHEDFLKQLFEHKRENEDLTRRMAEALDQNEKYARRLAEALGQDEKNLHRLGRQMRRAKDSLEAMSGHKSASDRKATLYFIFEGWRRWATKIVRNRAMLRMVGAQLMKTVEGEDMANLHVVVVSWHKIAMWHRRQRELEAEQERIRDIMNGKLVEEHERHARERSATEGKVEAGLRSVELAIMKWAEGAIKGLLTSIMQTWLKYAVKWATYRRTQASLQAAFHSFTEGHARAYQHTAFLYWSKYVVGVCGLRKTRWATSTATRKFLEGEERGLLHSVLLQWEAHKNYAKLHGFYNNKMGATKEELADEKARAKAVLAAEMARSQRRAEKHTDLLIRNRLHGEIAHLLCSIFYEWKRDVQEAHVRATYEASAQEMRDAHSRDLKHSSGDAQKVHRRAEKHTELLIRNRLHGEIASLLCSIVYEWKRDVEETKVRATYEASAQEMRDAHRKDLKQSSGEAQKIHLRAEKHTELLIRNRLHGEIASLISSIVREWKRGVEEAKARATYEALEKKNECLKSSSQKEKGLLKDRCLSRVRTALFLMCSCDQRRVLSDMCTAWREYVMLLKSDTTLIRTVKEMKARTLRSVTVEVDTMVQRQRILEEEFIFRAWLHFGAEDREAKEKAARLKAARRSKDMYEQLTLAVMMKAGSDYTDFLHQVIFDAWSKLVDAKKASDNISKFNANSLYYRERHQDDVRSLMSKLGIDSSNLLKTVCLAAWLRHFKGEENTKNLKSFHVMGRRNNLDRVSKAVAKWAVDAEDVCLGVVLRAFGQNVADARAATGRSNVVHVQKAWRSSALKTSSQYAEALEGQAHIKALLGWKVQTTQDRRDMLMAQCGDWSTKWQDTQQQSNQLSGFCDALRQNLAVQLLSAEQQSEQAIDQSDKLRCCTGDLWTEMHRQNLSLDSLEHEVLLLEAQNNNSGVNLHISVSAQCLETRSACA